MDTNVVDKVRKNIPHFVYNTRTLLGYPKLERDIATNTLCNITFSFFSRASFYLEEIFDSMLS